MGQGHAVDKFKFTSHGNPLGDPAHRRAVSSGHFVDVMGGGLTLHGRSRGQDNLAHLAVVQLGSQDIQAKRPIDR